MLPLCQPVSAKVTFLDLGCIGIPLRFRDIKRAGSHAITASDASFCMVNHRTGSGFFQRCDRTNRNTGRLDAVHALRFDKGCPFLSLIKFDQSPNVCTEIGWSLVCFVGICYSRKLGPILTGYLACLAADADRRII
jgi:hypothetical protein